MSKREDTHNTKTERDMVDDEAEAEFPRRLRLSSREIGVAIALTFAAIVQLFWSLSKPDEKLTSAAPALDPASIARHAR